jgi:hypothetical protein
MRLESFRVAHLRKIPNEPALAASALSAISAQIGPGGLFLDSCQRVLWIYSDDRDLNCPELASGRLELHEGMDAYRLLLRVAAGLESAVVGETDIFGQLKEAWRKSLLLDQTVSFWLKKVFEDTKEVRAQHLEHLGGLTYGSLARKHFTANSAENGLAGTTLLVGAGNLGATVAPYFTQGEELLILNRGIERAEALRLEVLALHPGARVRVIIPGGADEAEAWAQCTRAIVCIPADDGADAARVEAFRRGGSAGRTVLHLGCARAQAGAWSLIEGASFLDDIFRLQKSQGEVRSVRIALAKRACDERAKLRSLGGSMSIAHGWEDLALFA